MTLRETEPTAATLRPTSCTALVTALEPPATDSTSSDRPLDEPACTSTAARISTAACVPSTVVRWIWPSASSEFRASCTPSTASASPRSMSAAVASTSSRTA